MEKSTRRQYRRGGHEVSSELEALARPDVLSNHISQRKGTSRTRKKGVGVGCKRPRVRVHAGAGKARAKVAGACARQMADVEGGSRLPHAAFPCTLRATGSTHIVNCAGTRHCPRGSKRQRLGRSVASNLESYRIKACGCRFGDARARAPHSRIMSDVCRRGKRPLHPPPRASRASGGRIGCRAQHR